MDYHDGDDPSLVECKQMM